MTPLLLFATLLTAPAPDGDLRLVESFPLETSLDHADLPQTAAVWLELIEAAERELALSHFYASSATGSPLEDVIAAIERAGARGVRVRFLLSETFRGTYPEVPARLAAAPGVEVRFVDFGRGVMHAKYLVVDEHDVFLGSPNFDYRALEHIQELGVHLASVKVARSLLDVFELDWWAAGPGGARPWPRAPRGAFPVGQTLVTEQAGTLEPALRVTPVFSPRGQLPDETLWDLPRLVSMIEGAERSVRAQVLTYDAIGRDGEYFPDLEQALRAAAARGVPVRLLVADWGKRKGVVEGLASLACLENLEVRFVVVPEWSGGFQPFSRVGHAKCLVVDEQRAWIGSSNWERSYFTTSRNVGLILEGPALGSRLARWFDHTWTSEYTEPVVPGQDYEARRVR